MLDHLINPDEESKMDLAIVHHWDELGSKGETTFRSDMEDRTISMDEITADCLMEFDVKGLHTFTQQGLPFINELREKIRTMKHDLMETALEEFYS
jgi:hypothetical protein